MNKWLIVCSLAFSTTHFMHIYDENKVENYIKWYKNEGGMRQQINDF